MDTVQDSIKNKKVNWLRKTNKFINKIGLSKIKI
jgi:hypothetical protein